MTSALDSFKQPPADSPRARDVAWCADRVDDESGALVGLLNLGAEHVVELLRVAREHSIAVERLLEAEEILPIPMMSLVRSVHESFLEVCALSDPSLTCEQRLAAAAATVLASAQGNIAPLSQIGGGDVELPRVLQSVEDGRLLLERLGFTMRFNKAGTDVTSVIYGPGRAALKINVTELNKRYMPGTEHMWTLGSGGTHSRHWFTAGLEGSRDTISVMVVGPMLDSCDYVIDNVLGYVGLPIHDFHTLTHRRRNALLLSQQRGLGQGAARAGYAEYDAVRRGLVRADN